MSQNVFVIVVYRVYDIIATKSTLELDNTTLLTKLFPIYIISKINLFTSEGV